MVLARSTPQFQVLWEQHVVSYRGTTANGMANGTRSLLPFFDRMGFESFRGWHCNLFIRPALVIAASDPWSWYCALSGSHQIHVSEFITLGKYSSHRLRGEFPMQMSQSPALGKSHCWQVKMICGSRGRDGWQWVRRLIYYVYQFHLHHSLFLNHHII